LCAHSHCSERTVHHGQNKHIPQSLCSQLAPVELRCRSHTSSLYDTVHDFFCPLCRCKEFMPLVKRDVVLEKSCVHLLADSSVGIAEVVLHIIVHVPESCKPLVRRSAHSNSFVVVYIVASSLPIVSFLSTTTQMNKQEQT